MKSPTILFPIALALAVAPGPLLAQAPGHAGRTLAVDAAAGRHPISPLIYGVAFASPAQLQALNSPLNRSGGNAMTRYNWRLNASNHANDWYFESIADPSAVPGASVDDFVGGSKSAGAQAMVTIPTIGWVAKVGPNREMIPSFSVAKYGPQAKADPDHPDAGNGVKPDGKTNIIGNDPNDAHVPSTPAFQTPWVQHLVTKWGTAAHGGVGYYLMDNEPSLWNSTHRDVHPQGQTMDEELRDVLDYGTAVKSVDPGALVAAPEEWGWPGYFYSGADQQYRGEHHYQGAPDKDAHGGMDFIPWLLTQMRRHEQQTGRRLLDVCTVHIYPQGGDGGDDVSPKIQALRNRSTRSLWDPAYKDESWINDTIMLIPRLKAWVKTYYPGTKIGITEYNWGAEKHINGATAQADILGIFGREGLDIATRWTTPNADTPTFKAMQMYRNYDGKKSGFGDISVSDQATDPDALASFAAVRRSDGALTVMVIDKDAAGGGPIRLNLAHFRASTLAQAWQLTSANTITRLPDVPVGAGRLQTQVPAQSITLFIVPAAR
jgi:hypothetical protein